MAYPISDVTRRVVYTGSAGVGPYSFTFEVLANTDIQVYKNTTLLTLTTNYTVTINANGTGSVTLVVAATGADNITIVGDRAIQRATDFVTGGDSIPGNTYMWDATQPGIVDDILSNSQMTNTGTFDILEGVIRTYAGQQNNQTDIAITRISFVT